MKNIVCWIPERLYTAIHGQAETEGNCVLALCTELFKEGMDAFERMSKVYQPDFLLYRWGNFAQAYGESTRCVVFEVSQAKADAAHDIANDHNMTTPSLNTAMLMCGLNLRTPGNLVV